MSEGNVQEDVLHSRVHGCQAKSNIANSTESVTGAGWFILGRQNDERYVTIIVCDKVWLNCKTLCDAWYRVWQKSHSF